MATPMSSPPLLKHFDMETIELNNLIGRGQSCVYQGIKDGQEIAVKKMNCDKGKVPVEVEVQQSLSSHPNILPLLGVAHSKDMFSVYVCMERADMSLHQYLYREKRKPSPQLSLDWALQIARGIHHIHQHGLAHRDLKSANVLLSEKENIIKICDFGSAKALEVTAPKTCETGTYRWMAPEFIDNSITKINQRCDMFSYGMILYELFVHELPFPESNEIEVAIFIRDKKRPSIPSKLPKYLKNLMTQCWKHNAYDRPTSGDILNVLNKGAHLLQAAESGDVERVKQMMADFVDVNTRNEKEKTALHIASKHGHLKVASVLIAAKAVINLQDKNGFTPLYLASLKGHLPVVELLLKEKADINICDNDGFSPLYAASHEGHSQIVDIQLLKQADPNLTTKAAPHSSPLGMASEKGHVQTVKKLLEHRAHINHQDKNGDSPLFLASQNGHTQIVELLLRKGADPNLTRTEGVSPLFMASQNGHTQVVELLLREGADPNLTRTTDLLAALDMAAYNGHAQVVQKLLHSEATNINHQEKDGGTALFSASRKGHLEVVRLLLQAGAVDTPTKSGVTALSKATAKGHHEVVALMKQYLY